MSEDRAERAAAQETIFRSVNESIARGQWPGEENEMVSFRCECAKLGCNELIAMTRIDYDQVRSEPRRFVLIAGHEMSAIERVVERRPGYVVVEKLGEAGEIAEETDPRT